MPRRKKQSRNRDRDDAYIRQLGNNIRQAREAAGLSQTDLAEKAGLQQPTLQRLESGQREPSIGKMQRISTILNVQLESLLPPMNVTC